MLNQTYNEIVKFNEYVSTFKDKNYTLENAELIANEFFNKYDIDFMLVVGSTPSFNDGEPCEHWSDAYLDWEIYDYWDLAEMYDGADYEDHGYLFHMENLSDENFAYNENIRKIIKSIAPEHKEQRQEARTVREVLCDIYDKNFGTNYMVLISRDKNGVIKIEHEDYYDY